MWLVLAVRAARESKAGKGNLRAREDDPDKRIGIQVIQPANDDIQRVEQGRVAQVANKSAPSSC